MRVRLRRRIRNSTTILRRNFRYFLAEKLGKGVREMEAMIGNDEYVKWTVFYGRKAQREQLARLKQEAGFSS